MKYSDTHFQCNWHFSFYFLMSLVKKAFAGSTERKHSNWHVSSIHTYNHLHRSISECLSALKTRCTFLYYRWTDGSPDRTCPRYVARKQLSRLNEMGYSLLSGIEMEFRLFDAKTMVGNWWYIIIKVETITEFLWLNKMNIN